MAETVSANDPPHAPTLTSAQLMSMATHYLARYSASSGRLRQVLRRRVRRWHTVRNLPDLPDDATTALIDPVIARLTDLKMLDDEAFTLARARGLVRKGLPGGRVRRALAADGLDAHLDELDDILLPDDADQARRYAQRKRLGPFRLGAREPYRDKDIRSLLRAGFPHRAAVAIVDEPAEDAG